MSLISIFNSPTHVPLEVSYLIEMKEVTDEVGSQRQGNQAYACSPLFKVGSNSKFVCGVVVLTPYEVRIRAHMNFLLKPRAITSFYRGVQSLY